MKGPSIVLAALIAVATAVTLANLLREDAPSGSSVSPSQNERRDASPEQDDADPTAREPVAEDVEAELLGDFLARYWGSRWPEIRAALEEQGVDLSQPFALAPWEEVSSTVYEAGIKPSEQQLEAYRDRMYKWPEELTLEWLTERFGERAAKLRPDQVQELADLAAVHNDEIAWRVDEYLFSLTAALDRQWNSGEFVKAPYSTTGVGVPGGKDVFYGSAGAAGGWAVALTLTKSEHPDLASMSGDIKQRVFNRDAAVGGRLRELTPRDR